MYDLFVIWRSECWVPMVRSSEYRWSECRWSDGSNADDPMVRLPECRWSDHAYLPNLYRNISIFEFFNWILLFNLSIFQSFSLSIFQSTNSSWWSHSLPNGTRRFQMFPILIFRQFVPALGRSAAAPDLKKGLWCRQTTGRWYGCWACRGTERPWLWRAAPLF